MVPNPKKRWPLLALVVLAAVALVAPALAVSGDMLELKVRKQLLEKLGVDGMRVDVRASDDGQVLLSGVVKKRATAELAESVAQSVAGVTKVDDEIELRQYETTDTGSSAVNETGSELSDAALQTKVRVALIDRMGTDGFRYKLDVADGIVTLGFPHDYDSGRRKEAIAAAKSVAGVTRVVPLDEAAG
jgi:osmotically-inducible protein OsmY